MGVASHGTNQASTTVDSSTPVAMGGSRLSLQCDPIGPDTTTIRSLDWDRSRFDIEFGLRNGTTYNSFLVRGERTALIDTSHLKFEGSWLPLLQGLIDPKAIDHLIVSHT
jgi:flavorubredoxin